MKPTILALLVRVSDNDKRITACESNRRADMRVCSEVYPEIPSCPSGQPFLSGADSAP